MTAAAASGSPDRQAAPRRAQHPMPVRLNTRARVMEQRAGDSQLYGPKLVVAGAMQGGAQVSRNCCIRLPACTAHLALLARSACTDSWTLLPLLLPAPYAACLLMRSTCTGCLRLLLR